MWKVVVGLVVVGVIVLFATGNMFITTSGCTLPIDIVLVDTCLLGSFGASLGATIGVALIFGLLGLIGTIIKKILAIK